MNGLPSDEVKRPSLRNTVSNRLRDAIINGELKYGQRLNEVEIAQWLGVSRGLVREAMRELETSGLIVNIPYRGTSVIGLTPELMQELYTLRTVLEEYAVDLAVQRITDANIQELSAIVEKMRLSALAGDGMGVVDADMQFHQTLYSFSRHELLIEFLKRLSGQIQLFITATKIVYSIFPTLTAVADSHEPILDALRRRDPVLARRAVRDHICEVGEQLVSILQKSHQA